MTVVYFPGLGDLHFAVSNIAFGTVTMYGLIIAIGYSLAVVIGGMRAYKWRMSIDSMIDVAIWGTIAGIIGARLYYCIFQWDIYKDNPLDIFKIWEGGLAIYGGLIGALGAALIVCIVDKLSVTNLLDLCAMSFLLAQGIGRWGNFFNQEAFGSNTTTSPFRMYSDKTSLYLAEHAQELAQKGVTVYPDRPVHPTFLYESVWCIIGFFVTSYIAKRHRKFRGEIFALYLIWYGLGRTVIEGLRTDSLYIANTTVRVSQALSACMVLAGVIWLVVGLIYAKKHPLHQEIRPKGKKGAGIDWKNTFPHADGYDCDGNWICEGYRDPVYAYRESLKPKKDGKNAGVKVRASRTDTASDTWHTVTLSDIDVR